MPVLIAIALKSLLIAGLCLGLLQLMKQRSAAAGAPALAGGDACALRQGG
jgi:hypothetical protein